MSDIFATRAVRASRRCVLAFSAVCSVALAAGTTSAYASTLTLTGTPPGSITAGSKYTFTPTVSGQGANPVRFEIQHLPSWASFNTSTGTLSGTPAAANVGGAYNDILINVYAGSASGGMPAFGVIVKAGTSTSSPAASSGLTLSGSPAGTVAAGSKYSFTPTVSGQGTNAVRFAIQHLPSWASFNTSTGTLSGTPAAANVGGAYNDILINVYAGSASGGMPAFGIAVTAANGTSGTDKVTISGTPVTSVVAGSAYKFQPSATDSLGRTVSFSVNNKPDWATFSIATGLLSGTPTTSQTGTYANITISASDGTTSSTLSPFAISVGAAAPSTGSATLAWVDPTQNTNGSALTDLAGVRLYYGTSSSALNKVITVASTTQLAYTITGLTAGTWYFGAAAYTTAGTESAMSPIGSLTIQ
jgi:hypothetical protein